MIKKLLVFLSLSAVVLAASWALFQPEFFRAHDYIHAARVSEMQRALSDGHFPVRWSRNFGYGYGMPLFEFYAPLPYYFGAATSLIGLPVLAAVKLIFFTSTLLTAWGAYKLGQELFGRTGGVVAAAAITLAPYRAVNLFVRGAVSEAWGIMAMPWILWSIVGVIQRRQRAWISLVLWTIVLMLSHNIMTMLFLPLAGVFAVVYLGYCKWILRQKDEHQWKTLWHLLGSILLAGVMSAFYLLPAVLEKDLTQVGQIFSGYFHYSHHFLYIRQFFQVNWGYTGSVWGPEDGISFFLGWGQLAGLVLLGGMVLRKFFRAITRHKIMAVFRDRSLGLSFILFLLAGLSLYLTLLKTKPIWDVVPGLSFAQFPWRFLGVGIIFIGLLVGSISRYIKHGLRRRLVGFVLVVGLLFNAHLFQPERFLEDHQQLYYTDPELIQHEMSGVLPDYIPVQMVLPLTPPTASAWCEDCQIEVEDLVQRTHQQLVLLELAEDAVINLPLADFPGWQVELDGVEVDHQVSEVGNIQLEVPRGSHQIGARFGWSQVRLWSDVLSFGGWLLFLFLVIKPEEG